MEFFEENLDYKILKTKESWKCYRNAIVVPPKEREICGILRNCYKIYLQEIQKFDGALASQILCACEEN